MTRSEFDAKFNERYKESLLTLTDADSLKARLEKVSKGNNKISNDVLFTEAIMLSIEVNKKLLHSVLTDILEFDE